jgi:hypothetical protein
MSQHDQDLQQEQQLLEHFREHSRGEPSAAVDALILAAAHNALADAQPRLNWSQRLHAWLFGAGSRTRWSMAVAGLAVFGIGLNLSLHTRDQLPQTYDAPAPASAPALQEMAPAPIAEAPKQSAEREYKKAEQRRSKPWPILPPPQPRRMRRVRKLNPKLATRRQPRHLPRPRPHLRRGPRRRQAMRCMRS